MARKPKKWPEMSYGEGTWSFDEERRKIVLRFMLDKRRVSVLGESTTECMNRRDERRAAARAADEARTRLGQADATVSEMIAAWLTFLGAGDRAPTTLDGYRR